MSSVETFFTAWNARRRTVTSESHFNLRGMSRLLGAVLCVVGFVAQATPCDAGCDVVLTGNARKNVNGAALRGGETVCLSAGSVSDVWIHDVKPDAGVVTVRACDGTLRIAGGTNVAITAQDVSWLRITGDDGDGGRALIIDGTDAGYVIGVSLGGCAQHVELDHLEVFGTSYTSLRHGSEEAACPVQRGLFVHDNWFHDVGGEGLFVGMNKEPTSFTWEDVEIARNVIERPGYQGLKVGQVKNVWMHDNVIVAAGSRNVAGEDTGFPIGPRVEGVIERNVVLGAQRDCVAIGGRDAKLTVKNNLLVDCGNAGIVLGGVGHSSERRIDLVFNTIVRPAADGVLDWSAGDGGGVVANNLVVDVPTNKAAVAVKPNFDAVGNLKSASAVDAFASTDEGEPRARWRIGASHPARNAALASTVVALEDLQGLLRDTMPDVGAHEFAGLAPVVDAGTPDAGQPAVDDAGMPSIDAGTTDTGDAGVPEEAPPVSGGCGCSGGGTPVLAWLMFSLLRKRARR